MRIAIIADIHGNVVALDAVLAELDRDPPDELVCLGDVAFGPQPIEALARVRELGCPVIMGNWDAWFLDGIPPLEDEVGRRLAEIGVWAAARLSDSDREYVRTFLPTLELRAEAQTVLCFHGSPNSYDDVILATTPDEEVDRMLAGFQASVLIGGHTHFQMLRRQGEMLLVNAGSVGLPFRRPNPGRTMPIARWAEYGVVEVRDGHLAVELRRTPFDVEENVRRALASGMPQADWWAETWADD